jgi:putative endonuclease
MTKEKQIGDRGEEIAREFLERKGLEFLHKNYHAQGGELDIIMKDQQNDEYVFIEVKTRTNEAFGYGEESITPAKFEKILSAIEAFFLKEHCLDELPFFRVDAVIVHLKTGETFCEHIEDIGMEDFPGSLS